jgi:hypothetical protein
VVLAHISLYFGAAVAKLAKIHEVADGRDGIGNDLNQVHPFHVREIDCVVEQQDAQLSAVRINDPHYASADVEIEER